MSHKSSASSLSISANVSNTPTITKAPTQENITATSPAIPTITKSQTLPPAKPPRSEPRPPQDEWETKLFGNSKPKSNNINIYFVNYYFEIILDALRPGSSESLNRRSWDSSKLASQIVEESETFDSPSKNEDNISIKSTPEITKKEEKDSMFSKLKNNFRKGK